MERMHGKRNTKVRSVTEGILEAGACMKENKDKLYLENNSVIEKA